MKAAFVLAIAGLLLLCSFPAMAQAPPPAGQPASVLDVNRFAVAAGANYDWYAGEASPASAFKSEFSAGAYGAYVLTSHLAAYGAAVYGTQNKLWRVSPGIHWRLPDTFPSLALALTYDYYMGDNLPDFRHEWSASVIYAVALSKQVVVAGSESFGFDNRQWRTSVGVRLPLFLGRDS